MSVNELAVGPGDIQRQSCLGASGAIGVIVVT